MAEHASSTAAPYGAPRSRVERYIEGHLARAEALIAVLDTIDPDPDVEPGGDDEPSLCMMGRWSDSRSHDDREHDPSEEEASLGWTEATSRMWRAPGTGQDELEPSLGSVTVLDQRRWTGLDERRPFDAMQDLEDQCEDEAAQCDDEGAGEGW